MNYTIAIGAALVAAIGLTGCDSRNTSRETDRANVESGTTSPGLGTTGVVGVGESANAPARVNNSADTGTQEGDYRNVNAEREKDMVDRKVNPDHAKRPTTQPTSGATSESQPVGDYDEAALPGDQSNNDDDLATNDDVYHSDDNDDVANDDMSSDDVLSGSTSEAGEAPRVSYEKTAHPGGIAPEDRNLRFGLIGNGTGMGLEDTTSKNMTDNYTLSDPKLNHRSLVNTGALSSPTDDQDALKDIKSGTTFEYPEDQE